tara:strand:- start:240 stop:518 length:279 start_codon:yes stop_codon:yes gene_type:complete
MAVVLSNTKSSQALRGQDVRVTLASDVAIAYLPLMTKGDVCTNLNGSRTGLINKIDLDNVYFTITPIQPNKSFESDSTPGFLSATQTISIDL